jgi:hypothetical protein
MIISSSGAIGLSVTIFMCLGQPLFFSLQAMAAGINLHHKCLRSRLKTFSGYEIATEGDSFKCAFPRPEQAIMWAVMVQVRRCRQFSSRFIRQSISGLEAYLPTRRSLHLFLV